MEILARDYTLLQIIYLSRYKTTITTTEQGSPTAISVHQSPEEMSERLSLLANLIDAKKKSVPPPEPKGEEEDVRREVG